MLPLLLLLLGRRSKVVLDDASRVMYTAAGPNDFNDGVFTYYIEEMKKSDGKPRNGGTRRDEM